MEMDEAMDKAMASTRAESLGECLLLCLNTRDLEKPQHRCRNCKLPVSQICGCNKEDPNSSNPMHRVHVDRKRCKNRISIDCHYCGKSANSEEALNCHIRAMHTYSKQKPQNPAIYLWQMSRLWQCFYCVYWFIGWSSISLSSMSANIYNV